MLHQPHPPPSPLRTSATKAVATRPLRAERAAADLSAVAAGATDAAHTKAPREAHVARATRPVARTTPATHAPRAEVADLTGVARATTGVGRAAGPAHPARTEIARLAGASGATRRVGGTTRAAHAPGAEVARLTGAPGAAGGVGRTAGPAHPTRAEIACLTGASGAAGGVRGATRAAHAPGAEVARLAGASGATGGVGRTAGATHAARAEVARLTGAPSTTRRIGRTASTAHAPRAERTHNALARTAQLVGAAAGGARWGLTNTVLALEPAVAGRTAARLTERSADRCHRRAAAAVALKPAVAGLTAAGLVEPTARRHHHLTRARRAHEPCVAGVARTTPLPRGAADGSLGAAGSGVAAEAGGAGGAVAAGVAVVAAGWLDTQSVAASQGHVARRPAARLGQRATTAAAEIHHRPAAVVGHHHARVGPRHRRVFRGPEIDAATALVFGHRDVFARECRPIQHHSCVEDHARIDGADLHRDQDIVNVLAFCLIHARPGAVAGCRGIAPVGEGVYGFLPNLGASQREGDKAHRDPPPPPCAPWTHGPECERRPGAL